MIITENGDKEWWLNGRLHREDGPAIERSDGYKAWYLNGRLHRKDGPAIEDVNGDKSWYLNGHRQEGPIFEVNGSFYIDNDPGQEISQQALAWLKANKYIITQNHNLICVTFENKSDAALFKLFWL